MSASERVCVIEESIIDAVLGLVLSPLVEFVESGSCPWSSSFTNKSLCEHRVSQTQNHSILSLTAVRIADSTTYIH